jgi:CO dehydrogenase maturation factor
MKIALTGKGGVGKTTLAAALAYLYAQEGRRVLAVDADPDANLASALAVPAERLQGLRPIAQMAELIQERTGARPGAMGGVFKLNPRVEDIPEEFGLRLDGIVLLELGRSKEAASGCFCPENVFLRRLLKHLVLERQEVVVLDMEAGIEHLTRGTAEAMEAFIVVVEPGKRSLQTAQAVRELARGLGVKKVFAVANKTRGPEDVEFIRQGLQGMELLGAIGYHPQVLEADMQALAPHEAVPALRAEVAKIKKRLEELLEG